MVGKNGGNTAEFYTEWNKAMMTISKAAVESGNKPLSKALSQAKKDLENAMAKESKAQKSFDKMKG